MSCSGKGELDVDVCRVCLLSGDSDMLLIFECAMRPTIAEMLSELTIYKVQRFDNLPHLICGTCLNDVAAAYKLKQRCEQSFRKCIQLLGKQMVVMDLSTNDRAERWTQTDDTSLYPCERCEEKFFTYDDLRSHRRNDHNGSAMICRFCSRSFDRIGYLKTHIAVFHPESGYRSHNQCRVCKRQFTRREHVRRHMAQIHKIVSIKDDKKKTAKGEPQRNNTEDEVIPLEIDYVKIHRDQVDLRDEKKKDLTADSLSDNDGDEKLLEELLNSDINAQDSTDVLKENLIEVKLPDEGQPPMNSREDTINIFNNYVQNSKRSRGRPPKSTLICQFCDQSFDEVSKLEGHIVEDHKNAQSYHCKLCTDTCVNENDLRVHLNAIHNSDLLTTPKEKHDEQIGKTNNTRKVHSCLKCSKSFSTKNSLQKHSEKHEKAKCYVCKECSLEFTSRSELKEHVRIQGHDKPLLCPECGLRCKSSNSLMVHMRRHNGEKPFKCKFCSKGFPRMDDLRLHEKYHTGEKSHFCETCGKGFQRKYSLTIHLRVHTGEKPYKCPHCPQAFAQGNDLKAHIRRHTGERFRCEICNAAFLQGYQIRQHKLQEHGIHEVPPTQRVKKFTSVAEQEKQIQENMQSELTA